jgi:serine protease AprX
MAFVGTNSIYRLVADKEGNKYLVRDVTGSYRVGDVFAATNLVTTYDYTTIAPDATKTNLVTITYAGLVTNILAGNGLISGGKYSGIAPNANVIVIKALDANGETDAVTILKAMQWIIDNKQKYNIKVACMSFGSMVLGKNDPLIIGAEVLWNSGITVVAAAGNSGPGTETIKSPGASSKIITVGAMNDGRNNNSYKKECFSVASFSSRGPILGNYKPDILAPGVNICGASDYYINKQHYDVMSGTSVATPIIAGICCLLLSNNALLKPNAIKRILVNNTFKISNDKNAEGYGVIDCSNLVF